MATYHKTARRAQTMWGDYAYDPYGVLVVLNPQRGWVKVTSFRAFVAARKAYLLSGWNNPNRKGQP